MTELVIIADDLTGAADSAALLTRRGPTSVLLDAGAPWPDDTVLAVDTDSRHCDAHIAQERVAAVVKRAQRVGAQVVKKIDSTLRGNVAAELRAVADAWSATGDRVLLVVAPTFPATARTTTGGVVHVAGQRLTAHGSDGDVVGLLDRGGVRATHVALDALSDARTLAARLARAHADGIDAVVVDSETDDHLATVAAAAELLDAPTVLVGSGGVTRPLAGRQAREDTPTHRRPPAARPTLVVVGSYAAVSLEQRLRLVQHGVAAVHLATGASTDAHHRREVEQAVRRLRDALATGAAVLSPDPEAPVLRDESPRVAAGLAAATTAVLDGLGSLVATGGETARAVLTAAGVTRLVVTGEVEPGVVSSHVPELDLDVVTKAGGFGDPETLLRAVRAHRPITNPLGGDSP